MMFKGRTVLAFLLLGMFASSLLTLTVVTPKVEESGTNTAMTAAAPVSDGLTTEDLNKLSTTYNLIQNRFIKQVGHDDIVNGAIRGMLEALDDPYTTYMDPKEAEMFNESISSTFQGIGAEVSLEDGHLTIVSPMKDSPAEKAGLQSSDVIVSINGEKLEGLTLTQAVTKIRGPKGTQAKLGILRKGLGDPVEVIVVRDEIPVETVFGEMLQDSIGKIEIRQFSSSTGARFKEEYKRLEDQGMKALIIDVRNNPGGLLPVVVDIAEMFVAKNETVVQIEDRQGNRVPTKSENTDAPKDLPVAVLVNNGSASASEILAGMFKDLHKGKLVGEKTFGKGTVQWTFDKEMGDGSNIKMTTYKWLTPNGTWIHKKGIEPDVLVEQPDYYSVAPFSKKNKLLPDSTGDDVLSLQVMLQGLGFDPGRHDGYFSGKTEAALKQYQKASKLSVTGIADMDTMAQLEKDIVNKIRDPKSDRQLNEAIQVLKNELGK